jgi:hypothetical protein
MEVIDLEEVAKIDLTVAVGKGAILAVRKGPGAGYAMATVTRF